MIGLVGGEIRCTDAYYEKLRRSHTIVHSKKAK
jgi:hypothetical protein